MAVARDTVGRNGGLHNVNAQPGPAGPQNAGVQRTPQMANSNMPQPYPPQAGPSGQQQQQQQAGRGAKRSSTSPGEEVRKNTLCTLAGFKTDFVLQHEQLPRTDTSPPERKKPRNTPAPIEPPPMQPMGGPYPNTLPGGPPQQQQQQHPPRQPPQQQQPMMQFQGGPPRQMVGGPPPMVGMSPSMGHPHVGGHMGAHMQGMMPQGMQPGQAPVRPFPRSSTTGGSFEVD